MLGRKTDNSSSFNDADPKRGPLYCRWPCTHMNTGNTKCTQWIWEKRRTHKMEGNGAKDKGGVGSGEQCLNKIVHAHNENFG